MMFNNLCRQLLRACFNTLTNWSDECLCVLFARVVCLRLGNPSRLPLQSPLVTEELTRWSIWSWMYDPGVINARVSDKWIYPTMICKRCQRSLRSGEGLKCGICESCFHMRCVNDSVKDHREGGDKGYQWKCSLCQNYVSTHTSGSDINKEKDKEKTSLMQAVNAISEKFELVNKIQLPKLNSDLAQIKTVADRIVQQNNDILRKIDEIEDKRKNDKQCHNSTSRYRRRNLSLIPKSTIALEKKEEPPITLNEKNLRYRPRRRSYLLNRIFIILNRKMNKTQSPKR